MPRRVDLHTHSRHSDGTASPAEVVRRSKARGVELLVLTDHDTVGGCAEAAAEAARAGLRFGPGIEINTREGDMLHVLGYGIDPGSPRLAQALGEFRSRRANRIRGIVERLRAGGVDISFEEVRGSAAEALGRPHVADALRRKKLVRTRGEAFARYLSPGKPGYVEPAGPTVEEAIATIRGAGGWASLAHPLTVAVADGLARWVELGLEGLEAHYANHTRAQAARLTELGARYGLFLTGGSDYHGPGSGREELGGVLLPDAVLERFEHRLALR